MYFKVTSEGCAKTGWGWEQKSAALAALWRSRRRQRSQAGPRSAEAAGVPTAGSCPPGLTRTSKPGPGGAKEASVRGNVQAGAEPWDWADPASSSALLGSGTRLQVGGILCGPQPRRCQDRSGPGGAGLGAGRWDARGHAASAGAFLSLQPRAEERPG